MELPLISHPATNETDHEYPEDQLTESGALRLTAHNTVVANRASKLFGPVDKRDTYLRAAAALHDFGKATPQFQAYIRPGVSRIGTEKEKNHARLGALATWYILGRLDAPEKDRLAATLAIARHHQALPNTAQYTAETLAKAFDDSDDILTAQVDAIDQYWPQAATELFHCTAVEDVAWEEFVAWVKSGDVVDELHEQSARRELTGPKADSSKLPEKIYDRTLHYWSAITLADKSHAMAIPESQVFDIATLDRATIEAYIEDIRSTPAESDLQASLNDERERARRQAMSGVHEWLGDGEAGRNPFIATLTLPTGLGKTFTGLSAAFEARDMLMDRSGDEQPNPVVYALPYTSIIEQTRAIFEDPDLWGADPKKSALTVHHYLSETVVYHDEYQDGDVATTDSEEVASLLGESWRDGTVLTTFVQLFESLTGPSNRQGLKLPALDSSLVILDEPQALPKDWWDAIRRLLDLLIDEYQTRIIAMTATQPSLLRDRDTAPLLELGLTHETDSCSRCADTRSYSTALNPIRKEAYFEEAERVRYTIDETALSHQISSENKCVDYESAAERVVEETRQGGSTLAICNTIKSSSALTRSVCSQKRVAHLGPAIHSVLNSENVDAVTKEYTPREVASKALAEFGITTPTGSDGWSKPDGVDILALTLSSRYRPFDRQIIVELADMLSTSDLPFILVSTQAIEAGVDISFKTVFRDIAPLDSIVQAAGRCNRSYEWGRNGGKVIIWALADPNEENAGNTPPAYWVYESGSTDAGIPGHLKLISEVLAELGQTEDIPDAEVSQHAVDAYFDALQEKSLSSTEIRKHIDDAKARWLSQQSLIGGYETADVLVATTDAEVARLNRLTEMFEFGNPAAYDELDAAAGIRVSLPVKTIDDIPEIVRVDGKVRSADGVQVFRYTGHGGLQYELESGGLKGRDDVVAGRFTVI